MPVQVGGGLRDATDVAAAIAAGADARDPRHGGASATSTSSTRPWRRTATRSSSRSTRARGQLAAAGWTEQTEIPVRSVIERLSGAGVRRFVYSSIERDGMLSGPDLDGARAVAERGPRHASSTPAESSSLADLEALAELRQVNLTGVIVGKALYERRFDVGEAQAVLAGRH